MLVSWEYRSWVRLSWSVVTVGGFIVAGAFVPDMISVLRKFRSGFCR